MSEKLIPFDFEAFKADPSLLRQVGGADGPPQWAEPVRGNVVVMWQTCATPLVYWGSQFSAYLRLAAKTRTVRVRLLQDHDDKRVWAYTSDFNDLEQMVGSHRDWIGDAFDVEVQE